MSYVELLRVRNVLRILAIVLGAFIVIALILRIYFNTYVTNDAAFIRHLQMTPGSKVTHVVLPDGTPRTIIDDPKDQTHVTIDNLGYGGRHIVITEPRDKSHNHHENVTIGSVQVYESANGKTSTTVIDTNGATPFIFYMGIVDVMAFIIATVLGAPFARENDGHLEFALLKPVSRDRFALNVMGVDVLGIFAASIMTVLALLICQSMFEIPHFNFSGVNAQAIAVGIIVPLTWYAMLTAATSSLKRGYGAILGFAWPVAILVTVFGAISWGESLLGKTVHGIFWLLSRIDPLTYIVFPSETGMEGGNTVTTVGATAAGFGLRISIECLLLIVFVALALYQWRRVEA